MDHYIDLRILADPEFPEATLLNALFSKLHRELARANENGIGISFPNAAKTLGNVLRLHGTESGLNQIMANTWLQGLRDYTDVGSINKVPDGCQFRAVRRVQVKSNVERLMRRSIAKGWLTEEEAKQRLLGSENRTSKLPYLQLKSTSTGQRFKLFLLQDKPKDQAVEGRFNSYGLSQTATVPAF